MFWFDPVIAGLLDLHHAVLLELTMILTFFLLALDPTFIFLGLIINHISLLRAFLSLDNFLQYRHDLTLPTQGILQV